MRKGLHVWSERRWVTFSLFNMDPNLLLVSISCVQVPVSGKHNITKLKENSTRCLWYKVKSFWMQCCNDSSQKCDLSLTQVTTSKTWVTNLHDDLTRVMTCQRLNFTRVFDYNDWNWLEQNTTPDIWKVSNLHSPPSPLPPQKVCKYC